MWREHVTLNIVMVSHHFPPTYTGGVELITLKYASWLTARGCRVTVICVESIIGGPEEGVIVEHDTFEGIDVYRLHLRLASRQVFRSSYRNLTVAKWFAEFLRATRPDLVHVQSGYLVSGSVIETAKECGLPVVVSLHDYWFICPRLSLLQPNGVRSTGPEPTKCVWCLKLEQRRYRLPDRLTGGRLGQVARYVLRHAHLAAGLGLQQVVEEQRERQAYLIKQLNATDAILTQAPLVRDLVVQQGVDPERIRLNPYGLDLSQWKAVAKPTHSKAVLRIGYLGNLHPIKGVHVLVAGFGRVQPRGRNLQLTIHGDYGKQPDYFGRLKQLAGSDERIVFTGRYSNQDVATLLGEMDVLVVPSVWYETGPLVTLEAFACGVPVVAANLPNMAYQVESERNGLLYVADSVADLARQLQRLVDETDLLTRLRRGIRPVRTSEDELAEVFRTYQLVLAMK